MHIQHINIKSDFIRSLKFMKKNTRHYYSGTHWIQIIFSNMHQPDVSIHTQHLVIQCVIRYPTNELFRICRLMWRTEQIPPDLVRGVFMMIYKKGPRDDFANYRAICLLCHSYKLLSAVIARRLMEVLDGHLPDTQAGFRPARGCRDNVCALRWFIAMVLREGRNAVITFIDYSAAFDTESQIFLDGALADAGVSAKVRRIIQAVFAAATGIVRVRLPSGVNVMSEPFNIERGVLQGDIFSLVSFIAGLDKI